MKTLNCSITPARERNLLITMLFSILLFLLSYCGEKVKPVTEQAEQAAPMTEITNSFQPEEIFVLVDTMPEFPGGESGMMDFLNEKIVYPEIAKTNGIQGIVFLRFCITEQGKVDQLSVLKGANPALDEEAMRAVSIMPDWTPGRLNGKNVNVWYQLPVQFQLK